MNSLVTGKLSCAALQHLQANRKGHKQLFWRACSRVRFCLLGFVNQGFYFPGHDSYRAGGGKDRTGVQYCQESASGFTLQVPGL